MHPAAQAISETGSALAIYTVVQKRPNRSLCRHAGGFSLIDLLATVAVAGTIAGIGIPILMNAFENQRLAVEVRNVERELQTARLSAVSGNHPVRIRFNCPEAGAYRRVELLGTVDANATDDADAQAAVRCNYGAPDENPLTRPNHDGPTQRLNSTVTFTQVQTLEFWADGTVHAPGTLTPLAQEATVEVTRGLVSRSITVNSLGKIQIQ